MGLTLNEGLVSRLVDAEQGARAEVYDLTMSWMWNLSVFLVLWNEMCSKHDYDVHCTHIRSRWDWPLIGEISLTLVWIGVDRMEQYWDSSFNPPLSLAHIFPLVLTITIHKYKERLKTPRQVSHSEPVGFFPCYNCIQRNLRNQKSIIFVSDTFEKSNIRQA